MPKSHTYTHTKTPKNRGFLRPENSKMDSNVKKKAKICCTPWVYMTYDSFFLYLNPFSNFPAAKTLYFLAILAGPLKVTLLAELAQNKTSYMMS